MSTPAGDKLRMAPPQQAPAMDTTHRRDPAAITTAPPATANPGERRIDVVSQRGVDVSGVRMTTVEGTWAKTAHGGMLTREGPTAMGQAETNVTGITTCVETPAEHVRAYFAGLPQGGVSSGMVACAYCNMPWAALGTRPGAIRYRCPKCAGHWVAWRLPRPGMAASRVPAIGDKAWFDPGATSWRAGPNTHLGRGRVRLAIWWRGRLATVVDGEVAVTIRDMLSAWQGAATEAAVVVGTAWWCIRLMGMSQGGLPAQVTYVDGAVRSDDSCAIHGIFPHELSSHMGGQAISHRPVKGIGSVAHVGARKIREAHQRHDDLTDTVHGAVDALMQWMDSKGSEQGSVTARTRRGLAPVTWCPWPTSRAVGCPVWDAPVASTVLEVQSTHDPHSPYTPAFCEAAALRVDGASGMSPSGFHDVFMGHPQHQWLCNGAQYGFPVLSNMAPCRARFAQTGLSAAHGAAVTTWLDKQLEAGKMVDVTADAHRMAALVVSPFQTDEKADGSIRVCHNASAGGDASVNASINYAPSEPQEVGGVHQVISRIRDKVELSASVPMEVPWAMEPLVGARLDFKAWFRQIPIRPCDRWLMGQQHGTRVLLHMVFSFGARSAGHTACAISNAIMDVLCRDGKHWAICYNDDFIFIGTRAEVEAAVAALRAILSLLGLTENVEKYVPPSEVMDVLGHEVDMRNMLVQITTKRRLRVISTLTEMLGRPSHVASVQEIREVAGVLAFVGTTVPLARAYTAGLWSLAGDGTQPGHHRRTLGAYARTGMAWWLSFLRRERFEVGRIDMGIRGPPVNVCTGMRADASGAWGFGGLSVTHGVYIQGRWHGHERTWSIAVKEAVAAFLLLTVLAPRLSGQVVILQTDNQSVAYMLLTLTALDPQLRLLSLWFAGLQEQHRLVVLPSHVATEHNDSDGLSRGKDPARCLPKSSTATWSAATIPKSLRALGSLGAASLPLALNPGRSSPTRGSTTTIDLSMPGAWVSSAPARLATPMPFVPHMVWELRLREMAHAPTPSLH